MNIFNKQFSEITYQDVEDLVSKKIRESEVLDYKEQFETDAATKLISALANTYGGFIVYGVKCNKDTNEPEEIVSITDRKLDDTIDNICYDKIVPPVTCDSKYLYDENKSKFVFVIKVPESDLTPHAIENNTTVYIKVSGQKRQIAKAELDKQEWLKNKRVRSVEFRKKLLIDAAERIFSQSSSASAEKSHVVIKVIPKYPKQELIKHNLFRKTMDTYFKTFNVAVPNTLLTKGNPKHYDRGLCVLYKDSIREIYLDFNCYGLGIFKVLQDKHHDKKEYLSLAGLGNTIYNGLAFLLSYFTEIGFGGSILIQIQLSRLVESKLDPSYTDGSSLGELECARTSITDELIEEYEVIRKPIRVIIQEIMTDFFAKLAYIYGAKEDTTNIGEFVFRKASESFDKISANNGQKNQSIISQART